jgi:putative ABC transport system permease protein
MECFLAVRRFKIDGGETNVPIRGVQPKTFELRGDEIRITEGRNFNPGNDEVIVGRALVDRIRDCHLGDVVQLNTTPFKVVGIFESEGPYASEIWGDLDRMLEALERYGPNRVIARLKPGTDVAALAERIESEKEVPAKLLTEREYLTSQTEILSGVLIVLSGFLGIVMGIAAVFTATNTMLSALAARTHEIGILLATGFRPFPIFLSFLFESLVLGLVGGVLGCLLALPLNGIRTGTTNFQTFTEVAFAFRVTPPVLVVAVLFSLLLGLLGGAWPAWRAARMTPTEALRRR